MAVHPGRVDAAARRKYLRCGLVGSIFMRQLQRLARAGMSWPILRPTYLVEGINYTDLSNKHWTIVPSIHWPLRPRNHCITTYFGQSAFSVPRPRDSVRLFPPTGRTLVRLWDDIQTLGLHGENERLNTAHLFANRARLFPNDLPFPPTRILILVHARFVKLKQTPRWALPRSGSPSRPPGIQCFSLGLNMRPLVDSRICPHPVCILKKSVHVATHVARVHSISTHN